MKNQINLKFTLQRKYYIHQNPNNIMFIDRPSNEVHIAQYTNHTMAYQMMFVNMFIRMCFRIDGVYRGEYTQIVDSVERHTLFKVEHNQLGWSDKVISNQYVNLKTFEFIPVNINSIKLNNWELNFNIDINKRIIQNEIEIILPNTYAIYAFDMTGFINEINEKGIYLTTNDIKIVFHAE